MNRKLIRAALFAAAAFLIVAGGKGFTADEKLTIEDIMKQGHNKTKGLLKVIGDDAKATKWDDAKKNATRLKGFGDTLVTLKPEKGSEDSWKKLGEKYKTNTAAVLAAVEKQDAKATTDSLSTISKSCKECHDSHK